MLRDAARGRIVTALLAVVAALGIAASAGVPANADTSSGSAGSSGSSDIVLPVPTAEGLTALAAAFVQTGKPYLWGGVGPDAFDCSGLVQWAYKVAGVLLPRTSQQMATVGIEVPLTSMMPGDLIIFHNDASHVGLYAGFGQVFDAYDSGIPIGLRPLTVEPPIKTIRRV